MAFVDLPQSYIPIAEHFNSSVSLTSRTINTIGYGYGGIFVSPVNDTITEVSFKTNAINAGTMDVRLETVTANGLNSGTLIATGADGSVATLAADDNKYMTITINTPPTVTIGQEIAVVFSAGTASIGTVYGSVSSGLLVNTQNTVGIFNTTGTWARVLAATTMAVKFGTAGYATIPSCCVAPVQSTVFLAVNSTTTPDHVGNVYTPNIDCQMSGVRINADYDGSFDLKIFDGDGTTVLETVSVDATFADTAGNTKSDHWFSAPIDLTAGNEYFLAIVPTTASSVNMYGLDFNSADMKNNFMQKDALKSCRAKDPATYSDWTISDTEIFYMSPIITAIDIPAVGGGSVFGSAGGIIS